MGDKFSEQKIVLDSYRNRSEILRQAHSDLSIKYKMRRDIITIITIISSLLISVLAVLDLDRMLIILSSDIDTSYISNLLSFILAILGLIIFLVSLSGFVFGWHEQHLRHESGVKTLTNIINNIGDARKLIKESSDGTEVERIIKEIGDKYAIINETLPIIPDQDFLNAKQRYKIKREMSKKLDDDPWIDIDMKRYMKK